MLRPISHSGAEWPTFIVALAEAGLPAEDLSGTRQKFFALNSAPAFGGYFIAGSDALLRSIVVAPTARGRGLGRAIVAALLKQLESQGVERTWLLTTTAGPFFRQLGFTDADRHSAPSAIAATPQFQGICPSSAAFMCRRSAAYNQNKDAAT